MSAPADARTYITEIWCPPADNGVQVLSSHMPEPEPLPELELETAGCACVDCNSFAASDREAQIEQDRQNELSAVAEHDLELEL